MSKLRLLSAALLLFACDGGAQHEGGDHGGGITVAMGRAPRAANHIETHSVAGPDDAATQVAEATAEAPPADAPPADAPPVEAEAPPAEAEAPPAEAEAPPAEAEAPPAEAEAPPAEAPPPGTDLMKLAKIRLSNPKIDDGIDPELVRKRVRSGMNDLRKCYASGLERNAALAGRVELEFVIDKKGKIGSSTVRSSDLADDSVGACMAKAVEAWRFEPAPAGDVRVRFPFALAPE